MSVDAIAFPRLGGRELCADHPIENVLSRLEGVRQTARGKWLARCAAHDDRRPSLSVAEGDDGRVLLKCWAGCTVDAIVGAVGLEVADLFVPSHPGGGRPPLRSRAFSASDALAALAIEVGVVCTVIGDARTGVLPSEGDWNRFLQAAGRIERAAGEVLR